MKKRMKRTVTLFLAATMLILQVACGSSGKKEDAPVPDTPATPKAEEPSTKLNRPPKEEQILYDLNTTDSIDRPTMFTVCEVNDRQTNLDAKTDTVYATLSADLGFLRVKRHYRLGYVFSEGTGWALQDILPYDQDEWVEDYFDAEGRPVEDDIVWIKDDYSAIRFAADDYAVGTVETTYEGAYINTKTGETWRPSAFPDKCRVGDVSGFVTRPDGIRVAKIHYTLYDVKLPEKEIQSHEYDYLIDQTGNAITSRYDTICLPIEIETAEGGANWWFPCELDDRWFFIDGYGQKVLDIPNSVDSWDYDSNYYCCKDGLLRAGHWEDHNELYGYMNLSGEIAIPFQYDDAYEFTEGLAAVKKGELWGFIDTEGNKVTPFMYENVWSYYNGTALVQLNGLYGAIDTSGNEIIPIKYDRYNNAYTALLMGTEFVDNMLLTYNEIVVHNGCKTRFLVENDGLQGLIDEQGNEIIPFGTHRIGLLGYKHEGLVGVALEDGRCCLYDYNGNRRTPYYEYADDAGYTIISKDGKKGFLPLIATEADQKWFAED